MTAPIKAHLVELDRLDGEIVTLDKQVSALPQRPKIVEIRTSMAQGQHACQKIEESIAEVQRHVVACQDRVEALNAKVASEQKRLDEVAGNHREVAAISRELESLSRAITVVEEEELSLLAEQENLVARDVTYQSRLAELAEAELQYVKSYKKAFGVIAALKKDLVKQRDEIRKHVSDEWLKRYDEAFENKGNAVGIYTAGRCGSCHIQVPTSRVSEILHAEVATVCPGCRRLLIVVEDVE